MAEVVLTDVVDRVAVISLNRPRKHNAVDDEMAAALREATAWAVDAPDVNAILLRGEGPSFSSGRDTTVLGSQGHDHTFVRRAAEVNLRLYDCPKPVIAALRGYVLGMALELALAADMRVVAHDAKLGFPEVGYGLVTDTGGATHATVLAGPSRAKFLLMSGEPVDARLAVDWGLADWVVDPEQLDPYTLDLARRLAALPPAAVAMAKDLVNQVHRGAVATGTRAEMMAELALFASEGHRAAVTAMRRGQRPSGSSAPE